jgi:uncharacterized repeat protein (TIGR01451 family)/fimbrial isopeptide formation D2 family protein
LLFNVIAPVATIAVPASSPIGATTPQTAVAAAFVEPVHVGFTLEGCRNPSVDLEQTEFICADADYTTGNLGKTWNELDLVPHRLTTALGTQSDATTTYTLGIAADNIEAGVPGYDVMSVPIVNAAKSDATCSVSAGAETHITPGVGGTDTSLGRLFTITQNKGTTCVFDWVERLALGSHLFPGSSLHTNRTNTAWSTSGIGAADVSIPVKEILPQELSKDMSATQGQAYAWSISKSASPTSLSFENTCLTTTGSRSQNVQITVSWTRSGPNASGDTTIITNIYATNPAHRTITVNATDKIYAGSTQSTLLDTFNTGDVNVPAGSDELKIGTHTFVYSGSATTFNDVATASYKDLETGVAVPGNTSASASATTKPAAGSAANATAVISDSEQITGAGLAFSVATPSLGALTGGYVAGTSTTGPVGWSYTASGSGSVTFNKTVTVDQARETSGSLSDTATVKNAAGEQLASASASVAITSDAEVSLTINKSIPSGALRSGESVTFDFTITGPNNYSDAASITFSYGDSTTKSVTLSGLEPGTYTVAESPKAGWATQANKTADINLPTCSGSVTFNNTELAPGLSASKTADNATVTAGAQIGFVISVSNSAAAGTGTAKDVTINDPLPAGDGIDWAIASDSADNGKCQITGSVGSEVLSCDFGDMAPGASASVHVDSDTTLDICGEYKNTATIDAGNAEPMTRTASTTVNCPDVSVQKTTSTPTVDAGDVVSFDIMVSAGGTGDSTNVTLTDNLPAGVSWSASGTDAAECSIDSSGDPDVLSCDFGSMANGSSKSITLTGTADKSSCPQISNTATVDSDVNADDSNDSSTAQITVNCGAIDIEKTPDDGTVFAGDSATFTLVVSNNGQGTAKGVTVSDQLPDVSGTWADDNANCAIDGSNLLTCSLGDMAAGSSVTIHVSTTVTAADCGVLDNPAASVATTNDGSDSDAGKITVLCPDVSVVKTARASDVNAGDQVGYDITVTAGGSGDSTHVTLTDNLPAGIDWSENSDDCSITRGVLSCDFGTLKSGDSRSVSLTGTAGPEDCGTLSNTATVDSDVDVNSQNNSFGPVDIDVHCPHIAVEKTGSSIVSAGDAIHYTIDVSNVATGDAYDFELTDTLPAVSGGWTLDAGAPSFCDLSGNSLTCSLDVFEANDSFSVTLNATSSNQDCGELKNTAYISASNEAASGASDNHSSWIITVDCPNLTVEKSADNGTVSAGDLAEYTITVTNEGPGTAKDVHLDENVPDGLSWSIDSVTGADPASCASSVSTDQPQSITCDFGSLDEGESVTIHLSATTAAADCGTLHNVATVSGSNEDPEQLDDNQASADIVVECPGLNVAKDAVDDSIVGGDTAAFSIVVWNAGPGTARNVTLSDELPGGLNWTENSDDCSIANGILSCSFGDLGVSSMAESTARVTVSAETTRGACGTLENTAIASADNNEDVDDDASIAVHCPTVAIEKTNDQTASVLPGTVVTYSLKVTVGDGPAESVRVVDTLPAGMEDPTNISNGGTWNAAARTITWSLGDLATGEYSLSYQAAVSNDVTNGQELKNVVVVTSPNSQCPDAETLGPECQDDSTVTPRVPTLVIDKAADTDVVHFHFDADGNVLTVTPEQVTWTLTWTLTNGPVTNAVISDPLPEFVDYVDGSASNGGSYDAASRTLTWNLGTLSEASGSVTFKTTVDPDAPETGPIENVATIDSAETAPDQGVDSIKVTSDSEQASTGTPQPSLPDTALGSSTPAQPLNIPVWVVLLVFIGSLGSLTGLGLANLVAVRRRR